jgi:hypothetical protein
MRARHAHGTDSSCSCTVSHLHLSYKKKVTQLQYTSILYHPDKEPRANKSSVYNINMTVKEKSIYQEALEMVSAALVIYIFADIRELARDGKLDGMTLEDLEAPLTAEQTLMIIIANRSKLEEMAINREDVDDLLKAIKFIQAHQTDEKSNGKSRSSNIWNVNFSTLLDSFKKEAGSFKLEIGSFKKLKGASRKEAKTVVMTHFVDEKAKKEIVHAILVNPDRQRVTVVFRGSATPKDFIQDAKISQKKIENPVYKMMDKDDAEGMPATINVHTGFYQYLFKQDKETKKTRIESIMDHVKEQLKENPNFQLYVTGHSLGGALSTLFGFFAAADDEIVKLSPKGVVIYSVAR